MAMAPTEATSGSIHLLDIDAVEDGAAFNGPPRRRCERVPDQTSISGTEKPSVIFMYPPLFLIIWG